MPGQLQSGTTCPVTSSTSNGMAGKRFCAAAVRSRSVPGRAIRNTAGSRQAETGHPHLAQFRAGGLCADGVPSAFEPTLADRHSLEGEPEGHADGVQRPLFRVPNRVHQFLRPRRTRYDQDDHVVRGGSADHAAERLRERSGKRFENTVEFLERRAEVDRSLTSSALIRCLGHIGHRSGARRQVASSRRSGAAASSRAEASDVRRRWPAEQCRQPLRSGSEVAVRRRRRERSTGQALRTPRRNTTTARVSWGRHRSVVHQ